MPAEPRPRRRREGREELRGVRGPGRAGGVKGLGRAWGHEGTGQGWAGLGWRREGSG